MKLGKSFVEHNQTNIIVMSLPHRYDLEANSCVNNEVKAINRELRKHLKVFDNAFFIEVNSDTDHFTRHGLHFNSTGKEQQIKL